MTVLTVGSGGDEAVAEALHLLGHGLRLAILHHLVAGEKAVNEIVVLTGQSASVISQQLALLRKAGLVRTRREAKQVFYTLARERLREVTSFLQAMTDHGQGETSAPRKVDAGGPARGTACQLGAAMFARVGPRA